MKVLLTLLSASAIFSTFAFAEPAQNQNEVQNRFRTMNTNELLENRGAMTQQRDREQLHNELMSRQNTMTNEQKEKFMRRPDKVSNEMGMQGKGNAYGEGQGMMQGQGKKMMEGRSGKGKGGR
ncbi:MAG: hypothetical protein Q8N01_06255 [Sulfuricurvum sp.]|jgi:hypothetical protein|nr:hypothetical protein [Sulfuricurvum sp.]MDP3021624.1 hypothetical protein [Sulfuricurvum sp.]MDP3119997.1 hypothetical protein [Sulfuricurvum sp.]OYZ65654.1 MAG: hypothetical protein B7Y17_03015 [Sulfuricurvum sp. 24-42-5]